MIPAELRALAQWVAAGANKIPIDPKTGHAADVNNAATWGTYEQAIAAGLQHIGFVLTASDPYTIIDLDAPGYRTVGGVKVFHPELYESDLIRANKILLHSTSYTEWSQSGKGLHVILRGHIARGARRDAVEIYSQSRYIICTGNVFYDAPIAPRQELLDQLFKDIAPVFEPGELEDVESTLDDQDVFDTAMRAVNGDKFDRLCRGAWEGEWPSQSEADFALLSMLAFYTPDNEQVRRLFRMSALGKRDKAQRDDYLNRSLAKIRAKEPPRVDLSQFDPRTERPTEPSPTTAPPTAQSTFAPPPGLVGEIAAYIYGSSSRPVPEVSTCAAIAFVAGVVGRQFNVSGTGLNQYAIMLGQTGIGKEEAASGIDRIVASVRATVPMVDQFIGPGALASGQAIIRTLDKQPCFVSVLGEVGLTLQALSKSDDSNSLIMRRALLDLYNKSGWGKVLRPTAYSDQLKNTQAIMSPAFTLLGESTPEVFYGGLSAAHITDGLIPRFLIVEYKGRRPKRNRNAFHAPPPELVKRIADLVTAVLYMTQNNACAAVGIEPTAQAVLDEFDEFCDTLINIPGANDVVRQLWNRAHLKALRLAAVLAVANNYTAPIIGRAETDWAISLVTQDVERMVDRFDTGDVGEGDSKQLLELARIVTKGIERPVAELEKYGVTRAMWEKRVVPHVYLSRSTVSLASFRMDRRGATAALKSALETFVLSGRLIEINRQEMKAQFHTTGVGYYVP